MFSVVIPVFNKRRYVRAAAESVLRQTLPASELILVDDGSTDGSIEAVLGMDDPRVRVITQANAGPGGARNAGIAASRQEWIAFLDADDVWLEDHLAELDAVRGRCPDAPLIGTRDMHSDPRRPLPRIGPDAGRIGYIDYFAAVGSGASPFGASSAAVRKDVIREAGGFGSFVSGEDSEMWARLALRSPVAASSRVTALYLRRPDGLSETLKSRPAGSPPTTLSDLSPAVATVSGAAGGCEAAMRRSIDLFIRRYAIWAIHRSARTGDLAGLRAVGGLICEGLPLRERMMLIAARLPGPVGKAICAILPRMPG